MSRCVKSIQIRSFLWSVFSCIRTEYEDLLRKSPYSVRIQENTDQNKLHIWALFTQCLFREIFRNFLIMVLISVVRLSLSSSKLGNSKMNFTDVSALVVKGCK